MIHQIRKGQIQKSFPSYGQAWGIVVILGLSIIFMTLIAFLLKNLLSRGSFIRLIYSFIPYLIAILFMFSQNKKLLKILILNWEIKHWHRYISFILIVTGIVLFSNSILSIIKFTSIPFRLSLISAMSGFLSLKLFFAMVLITPLFEEFIFRGIVLEGLLTRHSPLKAILLSSLLFSIMHFNPFQLFNTFFLGLFTAWYYFKTRNLLSCIIIHSMYNLVNFLFNLYFVKKSSSILYSVNESLFLNHSLLLFFFIAVACAVIGILGIRTTFSQNRGALEIANS